MNPLGTHILSLMKDSGIKSIHALSAKVGISKKGLTKIIYNEDNTPRHATLKKLANFFNVPLSDLSAIVSKPVKPTNPLADNLNHLMQIHYYNQHDVEKLSGVPRQLINKILHGSTKKPHLGTLKKLADCFEITVDQLTGKKPLPNKYKISRLLGS